MMRITLKKYEAGRSYIGQRLASGLYEEVSTIVHYKVGGLPQGQETSIALRGGRYNRHWEIFQDGSYSGYYKTADEALTSLQNSVPN
jgi:hypothetical protein